MTELVLAAAVLALAWPADAGALTLMAGGFVAVAVAAATHDIAIDGFYLVALDKDRQASFSGLRVGAYRLALLAGALLVALAGVVALVVLEQLAAGVGTASRLHLGSRALR